MRDAALLLAALAGDVLPGGADEDGLRDLRVGVPSTYYFERVDPEVEGSVRAAIVRLRDLGAELVEVTTPMDCYVHATHWGLMVPEATAYHEQTLRSSPQSYGPDVRVLLEAGELVSAGDYLRAQRARTLLRQAWARVYEQVNVVAAPTVPMTAVPVDQHAVHWPDGTVESVSDAYVRLSAPANITGMPALTLPVGRHAAGLPIGMQLMGAPLADATVLRAGRAYEAAHGVRTPPGVLVS